MFKIRKILHIDIENGYGGSSRSLSLLIKYLKKNQFNSEIWIAKKGPALSRNKGSGKNCKVNLDIKFLIPLKKNNIKNIIISIFKVYCLFKLAKKIKKCDFDILHLNHDGLLLLAFFLRLLKYSKKIIIHKRYIFPKNIYGKYFAKFYKFVDGIICISKMEKKIF